MATDIAKPRVLVVGGGYVGMYAALRLQKKLSPGEATITVVDPQPNMTYQPFLPEAAAGAIEARHVVVPLRRVLRRSEVLAATVESVDHGRRVATLHPSEGESVRASLRRAGDGARLGIPRPAHPRPRGGRHRLQDHRGGRTPAQPHPLPAGRGLDRSTSGSQTTAR
jgi:NADPH-dependent 2,4-dienoyl-CoA reductase/sulfur reductase-like enzyme